MKQYPGYLRNKRIQVSTVNSEMIRGTLLEIQDYSGKKLLIVQLDGTDNNRIVNFDHVISIDEL